MTDVPSLDAPSIGHNQPPDWAKLQVDRLTLEYSEMADQVTEMLAKARADIPVEITDDTGLAKVTTTVVTMRDMKKRLKETHGAEKEPFLRQGQGVDTFFFSKVERLDKAMEIIGQRGDDYNQRKAAAIRAQRIKEAQEAAAQAEAERKAQAAAAAAAAEAEAAAARARKPENIQAHQQVAETNAMESTVKGLEAMVSEQRAAEKATAAQAPTADLVRTRHDTGHMSTMGQSEYVEIVDANKLDLEKLRPYFTEKELTRVLKAWAKVTGYKQAMPGAIVEMRDKTSYK